MEWGDGKKHEDALKRTRGSNRRGLWIRNGGKPKVPSSVKV